MNAPRSLPRSFARFLAAILLPLIAFALITLTQDRARRYEETRTDLAHRAEEYAVGVVERLRLADTALEVLQSTSLSGGQAGSLAADALAPYFSSVAHVDFGQPPSALADGQLRIPPLSGAARVRLAGNAPVLALGADSKGAPRLLLLRGPPRNANDQRSAVAVLDPGFLWGTRSGAASDGIQVLGADASVLYPSVPRRSDALHRFDPAGTLAPAGEFEWVDSDGRHLAIYLPIPIAKRFALPDWTLVASRPAPATLDGSAAPSALAAALGLALLAAGWLSRSERSRAPLENAPDPRGTNGSVARTRRLTRAQSNAARAVAADTEALAGIVEIDRAILAHASVDRIVKIAMRQAAAVLDCDLVAVSILERNTPNGARTLSCIARGTTTSDRDELPLAQVRDLAGHPEGRWVEDPGRFTFLRHLVAAGAKRLFLLPIYCEGHLAAVLCVGRVHPQLEEEAATRARPFATRLGVALTVAARAAESHFLQNFESLTGLPNRRHLRERLSQEVSRASRAKSSLALLHVDLDQFKRVNDGAGHEVGDVVLKEAADRLRCHLREEDLIAHFGGDEFVLLLPGISGAADAGRVAEKLLALLSQPFSMDASEHHLTGSIGIAIFPNDARAVDTLLQNADSAMSRAKRLGRSQYVFFEDRINATLREQFEVESELRRALTQQELVLFYQPQLDVRSGKLVGAEALIRWQHPERGLLSPNAFIEIAEDCGLIEQIGEYVRTAACAQYRAWEALGLGLDRISVNVAGCEFNRKDFVPKLEATLLETGIRPFALDIEITERTLVDDSDHVLAKLKALRDRGIRIAIDDFGTGYSSLSYLKRMPFDMLKVDRSFISDIGTASDVESCAVASAILGIAHGLGKEVCAEGVETESQRTYLTERGCELLQGYLISPPLPAKEFEAFLRRWGDQGAPFPAHAVRGTQTRAA